MDILRSGYSQPVRGQGNDTFAIRWYPCAPGALNFPGPHAYGSLVWEGEYDQQFTGPGAFTRVQSWSPSHNPGYDGQCLPANLDWFRLGLPETLPPQPAAFCCALGTTGQGGAAGTGSGYDNVRVFQASLALQAERITYEGNLALSAAYSTPTTTFEGDVALSGEFQTPSITFAGSLALSGEFTAIQSVVTSCCPANATPLVLTATFGIGSGCSVLDGLVLTLTYDPVRLVWLSPLFGSGLDSPYQMFWQCLSLTNQWNGSIMGRITASWRELSIPTGTCSPYSWSCPFLGTINGPCVGVVTACTITG
jgi:hypothetical protein